MLIDLQKGDVVLEVQLLRGIIDMTDRREYLRFEIEPRVREDELAMLVNEDIVRCDVFVGLSDLF